MSAVTYERAVALVAAAVAAAEDMGIRVGVVVLDSGAEAIAGGVAVGAIGVSGGTADQDIACCEAALS